MKRKYLCIYQNLKGEEKDVLVEAENKEAARDIFEYIYEYDFIKEFKKY